MRPPKAPQGLDESPITLAEATEGPDFRLLLTHIRELAGEVHSVNSPGLARTQQYLKDQITGMGYDYTVESYDMTMEDVQDLLRWWFAYTDSEMNITTEEIRDRAGLSEGENMQLHNILVSVDAPGTDETVIVMAHTDSVKEGPGAFDDIVSVAAMLEGLRAVQGEELKRDLLFLFTDGEEQGILGAAKFVQDHPEYKEKTSLVMNLEARGNSGVLILFQTSDKNLELVKTYQKAVSYPFSTSFATAVYKTMPNDTDLTHFLHEGYTGINFAVVENAHVYHTPLDNYDTFNRDSAFHYLNTTVELVRYFALSDTLNVQSSQDSVHFPFLPGRMIVFSQNTANIMAHAAFALTLLMLWVLMKAKRVKLFSMFITFGAQILCMLVAGGSLYGMIDTMYKLYERHSYFADFLITEQYGAKADTLLYILLIIILALAAFFLHLLWKKQAQKHPKGNDCSGLMGVLLLPALLAEVCVWLMPGAVYLFCFPVLAALIAIAAKLLLPGTAPIFTALAIFVSLLLYVPLVYLLCAALLVPGAVVTIPVAILTLSIVLGKADFGLRLAD